MDIDYIIEKDLVFVIKKDPVEKKIKKRRNTISLAEENLRKMLFDRITGKTGDC